MYQLDKSIGPEAAPKPFTRDIKCLIAWLTMQDPSRIYEFFDTKGECLLAQFVVGSGGDYENSRNYHAFLGEGFSNSLDRYVACPHPWTYGDALYRARTNEWRFYEEP
jgi:hypothetical protein